ncbi:hypothetical protein HPG69_008588 [Diceros bicornis minor]|uniref:Shieldin complex subunit 1 C-terminal domain-containing protein n=1 Tax=Diceros bicornis minor TaxID=77932 RepID=A0A7J7FB15_DICBM|nr:hypothetical protein HPG69_008588 [Diceros bicornis minor]
MPSQDSSNLNAAQNDSWTSENFWLDLPVKGQPETKEEDDGLRKSLDRFYEMFGRPQPASGDPLSTSVCQCLSQKINELKGQENQKYALRSFQMARIILNQDGCSVLRRHSRDAHFYASGEGSVSLEDEKPIPGLSKEVLHFLLQQNIANVKNEKKTNVRRPAKSSGSVQLSQTLLSSPGENPFPYASENSIFRSKFTFTERTRASDPSESPFGVNDSVAK